MLLPKVNPRPPTSLCLPFSCILGSTSTCHVSLYAQVSTILLDATCWVATYSVQTAIRLFLFMAELWQRFKMGLEMGSTRK